ncbi:MAG TPA: 50S ribosomal protein L28 [Bacillota bacterium]|nr:50S ribosomal protein L28 [Bacillota bacterium]HOH10273.1 50S ribosomal protein L28 [Bacillota bacterium]HOY89740.1 50S ribosomal protein L28 [Bacillota bacterium]HPI02071.1 50S ribosomal protein L28 [Bacillota bacterium]HPM64136.1 50S ribosomal protein L28 [Bacillota bacterium]
MSKVCEICNKGPVSGHKVSNSMRHTKRRWLPNLQNVKAVVNGSTKRIRVCTNCLKSGKVVRAV